MPREAAEILADLRLGLDPDADRAALIAEAMRPCLVPASTTRPLGPKAESYLEELRRALDRPIPSEST